MAKEIAKLFITLGMDDKGAIKGIDKIQKNMSQAGKAMAGVGIGITAVMGLAVKSAAEEEAGIQKLNVALHNVGVEYADVREELEATINATQQKTSIADDQQRAALAQLVAITGDYQQALELLPVALDLATGADMDLITAAQLLGKVNEGNMGVLSRYGIVLEEGATATEAFAAIQGKYAGQAEAYGQTVAGQFELMKNNIGDLMESIGSQLLPILKSLFEKIQPVIQSVIKWIEENPALTKTIVIIVAAVGALMAVLGPLLMMLPMIAAGFTMMMGPVGLIILAVTALAAGAALVIMNWDKIKEFFAGLWDGIKKIFWAVVDWVKEWGILFIGPIGFIIKYWDEIVDFFKGIPEKIGQAFSKVKDFILTPFRAAWEGIEAGINWVISMLNKISFDFPDWVPGLGGKHFGIDIAPVSLPKFHSGGTVPGVPGQEVPIMALAGETVIPAGQGGGGVTININNPVVRNEQDINRLSEAVSQKLRRTKMARI